jgi:hypothetical protein
MRAFPRLLTAVAVMFAMAAAVTCLRSAAIPERSVAQRYCYDVTLGFYPYTHASLCPPVSAASAA